MASNFGCAASSMAEAHWCESTRAKKHEHRGEKWLVVGLTGAGIAAMALWVRVVFEMVNDIMLAGAAYFGS